MSVEQGVHVRDSHDEVEQIARQSYGRLVAMMARRTRDLAAAEDAIGEGFRRALETWPRDGVPVQPEAWIVTVARRALIDQGRRAGRERGLQDQVEAVLEEITAGPDAIADERLELMLLCAHPAIDAAVRTPLILQCVLGLDAARIAAAYVVSAATMSQRLVRAKGKIKDAGLRFGLPEESEWGARLGAVLDAVYVAFTCGWEADDGVTGGGELSREAIDLGRAVATLVPGEAEPQGLVALMLYVQARAAARREGGKFVPLDEQNVERWSVAMMREAESRLKAASGLARPGRFVLEAAIQSAHVDRRVNAARNWNVIVGLYEHLAELQGGIGATIGATIGLAAALVQSGRAGEALECLDAIDGGVVESHQPYWAVRGRALGLLGKKDAAREAYERAIELTTVPMMREYVAKQCALLTSASRA